MYYNTVMEIKEQLRLIPESSGSYQFYDENNEVIYVGKAKNLKRRVSSYFNKKHDSVKLKIMVPKIKRIEFIITNSEVEKIYYQNYWINTSCHNMTPKFAILSFDTAVNMGKSRVKDFLKIAQWKYPEKFLEARKQKYIEFSQYGNQKIFLQGWLNRLNALEQLLKIIQ